MAEKRPPVHESSPVRAHDFGGFSFSLTWSYQAFIVEDGNLCAELTSKLRLADPRCTTINRSPCRRNISTRLALILKYGNIRVVLIMSKLVQGLMGTFWHSQTAALANRLVGVLDDELRKSKKRSSVELVVDAAARDDKAIAELKAPVRKVETLTEENSRLGAEVAELEDLRRRDAERMNQEVAWETGRDLNGQEPEQSFRTKLPGSAEEDWISDSVRQNAKHAKGTAWTRSQRNNSCRDTEKRR